MLNVWEYDVKATKKILNNKYIKDEINKSSCCKNVD